MQKQPVSTGQDDTDACSLLRVNFGRRTPIRGVARLRPTPDSRLSPDRLTNRRPALPAGQRVQRCGLPVSDFALATPEHDRIVLDRRSRALERTSTVEHHPVVPARRLEAKLTPPLEREHCLGLPVTLAILPNPSISGERRLQHPRLVARPSRTHIAKPGLLREKEPTRMRPPFLASLLPERHPLPGVPVPDAPGRTHPREHDSPHPDVRQMPPPRRQRAPERRRIEPPQQCRPRRPVDQRSPTGSTTAPVATCRRTSAPRPSPSTTYSTTVLSA